MTPDACAPWHQIGWSDDDLPELGGDIPLNRCLAEARIAGYEGIELGHNFPRDLAVLRPILDRFGLALISGWYSGRLLERSVRAEIAAIEPHTCLLAAMGSAVMVYAETSVAARGIVVERALAEMAQLPAPYITFENWKERRTDRSQAARLSLEEVATRVLAHRGAGDAQTPVVPTAKRAIAVERAAKMLQLTTDGALQEEIISHLSAEDALDVAECLTDDPDLRDALVRHTLAAISE